MLLFPTFLQQKGLSNSFRIRRAWWLKKKREKKESPCFANADREEIIYWGLTACRCFALGALTHLGYCIELALHGNRRTLRLTLTIVKSVWVSALKVNCQISRSETDCRDSSGNDPSTTPHPTPSSHSDIPYKNTLYSQVTLGTVIQPPKGLNLSLHDITLPFAINEDSRTRGAKLYLCSSF